MLFHVCWQQLEQTQTIFADNTKCIRSLESVERFKTIGGSAFFFQIITARLLALCKSPCIGLLLCLSRDANGRICNSPWPVTATSNIVRVTGAWIRRPTRPAETNYFAASPSRDDHNPDDDPTIFRRSLRLATASVTIFSFGHIGSFYKGGQTQRDIGNRQMKISHIRDCWPVQFNDSAVRHYIC